MTEEARYHKVITFFSVNINDYAIFNFKLTNILFACAGDYN